MKKIKLKMKFDNKDVICAKTPRRCEGCRDRFDCDEIELTYDEFQDIKQTYKNKYGIDETKCKGR